jgi:hypothetical protein
MKKLTGFMSFFKKQQPENGNTSPWLIVLSFSSLFIISFVSLCFFQKGHFFYQEHSSLFIFTADYLQKFTSKPGGLLIYAGNFLTQFYYNPVTGSLIISVLLILICVVINKILRMMSISASFSLFFSLLPSCALLALQMRYDFHIWHMLGFLFVLTWFLPTLTAGKASFKFILIILFPLLFYIAGSFAIIYTGLYLTCSFLTGKGKLRYILPASLIVISAITFFVFRNTLFYQPSRRLILFPLFVNETSRLTLFLSVMSAFLMILPFITKIAEKLMNDMRSGSGLPVISVFVLMVLTVFILGRNYDPDSEIVMKFESMACSGNWDKVIRDYENSGSSSTVVQYYYNLALSEKGELCNRMFFGRQSSGSLSLTLSRDDEYSGRAMYFYYATGLTAEAHHIAYEQMVQHGYQPENIRMLIRTELINGNFRIAKRYINVLKKTLHYRNRALKYERFLNRSDLVKADPELGSKISLLPAKDFFVVTDDFKNVDLLLQDNPGNRIAYEYKLARLLLEKDLMEIGSEVKKMRSFGYTHIPRHIEEAIVSLVNVTKEFPDMGGLTISSDTDQRFLQYFSDLKSLKGNRKQIENQLKKVDRNTFWYYLQFGLLKNNRLKSEEVDNSIY